MVESNQKKITKFLNSDRITYKGLEKENLRSDTEGKISNKSFPKAFGVHNFNRYVTSTPDLFKLKRTKDDLFLVLARSD